jgi:hypothetical protein
MKNEIFDLLSGLTPEPVLLTPPHRTPEVEISRETAFCLHALMNELGRRINMTPVAVYEALIMKGIAGWLSDLPESHRRAMGISKGTPATPPVRHDDTEDAEDDHLAAKAQQAAYAKMTESYTYTPMTAHAVEQNSSRRAENQPANNGGPGRNNHKKKPHPDRKNYRQSGGSRRRRHSESRSHSQR